MYLVLSKEFEVLVRIRSQGTGSTERLLETAFLDLLPPRLSKPLSATPPYSEG